MRDIQREGDVKVKEKMSLNVEPANISRILGSPLFYDASGPAAGFNRFRFNQTKFKFRNSSPVKIIFWTTFSEYK